MCSGLKVVLIYSQKYVSPRNHDRYEQFLLFLTNYSLRIFGFLWGKSQGWHTILLQHNGLILDSMHLMPSTSLLLPYVHLSIIEGYSLFILKKMLMVWDINLFGNKLFKLKSSYGVRVWIKTTFETILGCLSET